MFTEAVKLIESKSYDKASAILEPLSYDENAGVAAKANFLIGYINTRWDNKNKNSQLAKRSLLSNINSAYPQPYAYIWYADVEDDINIATNYLKKGIQRFPKEPKLYEAMLQYSNEKNTIVEEIKSQGFDDVFLLGKAISYLITAQQWDNILLFASRIRNGNELEKEDDMYLTLIEAYARLFGSSPDYKLSHDGFYRVLEWDTNNRFAYAHYVGIIYTLIKLGDTMKATEYFDRLPLRNSLFDLSDGPCPMGIYFEFEAVYKTIFDEIKRLFSNDPKRKKKAYVIYILYLCYPSEIYGTYQYKKSDATVLGNYLKSEFNIEVGAALYHMKCHFGQLQDAYEVLWAFLKNYKDPEESNVFLSEILAKASNDDIEEISNYTSLRLKHDDFDKRAFERIIFPELIECMHSKQLYGHTRNIAKYISISAMVENDCAFECAYAYGEIDDIRAAEIYNEIIKNNSTNSAAINNLGVQYEHKENYYAALACYQKAVELYPSDQMYTRNYERTYDTIQQSMGKNISQARTSISVKSLKAIGYTVDFCKVIFTIQDESMRNILLRDLQECAIAVVAGQDKLASIMCGSIIEALLIQKMRECGIEKYDLTEIRKNAVSCPICNMGLNELLYVANKEHLISSSCYHLGHYVRDYRNIVHPAKEVRMKEEISHETVLTMWTVLKQISSELFGRG